MFEFDYPDVPQNHFHLDKEDHIEGYNLVILHVQRLGCLDLCLAYLATEKTIKDYKPKTTTDNIINNKN